MLERVSKVPLKQLCQSKDDIGPLIMASSIEPGDTFLSKVKRSIPGTRRIKVKTEDDERRLYHSTMVEHQRRMADFDTKYALIN